MKKLLIAAAFLLFAPSAWAACPNPVTAKDAAGTTQNFTSVPDASGNCESVTAIVDTGGVTQATVKASGASSLPTDTALVTAQSPNPSPQCTGIINITQTATTDVHSFSGFGYICSIVLISATAQNIGIDEGTGTTCETSGFAILGVSSTAAATPTLPVGANGGFTAVTATPWLKMHASADHLCILQSGSGNVSGTITYADHS
jgi:hypothetical protein